MNEDVIERAERLLAGTAPGPWHWGGNTDNGGDVVLQTRMPGLGTVHVMRSQAEYMTEEELFAEWDRDPDLQKLIGREDYVEDRLDNPRRYLAFLDCGSITLAPGRDLAVYEVARNQNLPDDTPREHPAVYRADVVGVRNPNAELIAAAPKLVADLRDEVRRLRELLQIADGIRAVPERM